MAWTTPKTWTVGEVLTAANMNVHVRDNLIALRQLDARTSTGKNNAAFTFITMDTNVELDMNAWAASSGQYWEAPWAGRFEVTFNGLWTGASGAGQAWIAVRHYNAAGSVLLAEICADTVAFINGWLSCSGVVEMAVSERLYFGEANGASGPAGSLALRASVKAAG